MWVLKRRIRGKRAFEERLSTDEQFPRVSVTMHFIIFQMVKKKKMYSDPRSGVGRSIRAVAWLGRCYIRRVVLNL